MQWYVEMLHLINESDRGGEGEAQPGNGPEERGQIKWGICLLQGEKKKKLLKAGTQTSLFKNGLCKSVQFRATKLTPVLAFCHVQQYPVSEKPVEKAVHWPVSASVSGP